MKLALALAALAALCAGVPSYPRACESPGPCVAADLCEGSDCDAPAGPAAQPWRRCDSPDCDRLARTACEGTDCDEPDAGGDEVAPERR